MARETQRYEITVAPAKGRPMLQWAGKRALDRVIAYPSQQIERHGNDGLDKKGSDWADWPANYPYGGLIFHGDNKEVLAHLLAEGFRGKVKCVYIDPPFDSGADYVRRITLRGPSASPRVDGESYSLGEQVQYTDIWANDSYLQFMYERLILIRELLTQDGVLWLHADPTRGHYLKCILDEIFGQEHFINQVVWKRSDAHGNVGQGARHLGTVHDMLLLYSRGDDYYWNPLFDELPETTVSKWYRHVEEGTGRRYNLADMTGPGGSAKGNPVYEWNGVTRAWRYSRTRMDQLDREGRIEYSASGMAYQKRYLDESKGVPLQDWWDDISMIRGIQRRNSSLYPTEKPERLVERILEITSAPGDLVLDCFVGSGTTAAVAQRLGRRWIVADINLGAVQETAKRIDAIISGARSQSLIPDGPPPAQHSFTVWRVNDYDLQIQHNEAVAPACDFIGVEQLRSDAYFDGTLGKSLVKVAPFNHPLTPLDLEELKQELDARPDEDRNVTMVCLGIELASQSWIEEWNRLRRGANAINRIEVIELRTDPRYGGVIQHEPAQARVDVTRQGSRIKIEVQDFLSPTIIQRLQQQGGLLNPQIDDWRAMVDSVAIDTAYDGAVLNVVLADIPEKKTDLVRGTYDLEAPSGETTVASMRRPLPVKANVVARLDCRPISCAPLPSALSLVVDRPGACWGTFRWALQSDRRTRGPGDRPQSPVHAATQVQSGRGSSFLRT